MKEFDDAEFTIVGVIEGRGNLMGHGIFECTSDKAPYNKFEAKLKGPRDNLRQYLEHPERAIGKIVTVQFQGYTRKSKVPRFPVALRFRADV